MIFEDGLVAIVQSDRSFEVSRISFEVAWIELPKEENSKGRRQAPYGKNKGPLLQRLPMTAPLTHRLDDAGRAALREVAPEIVRSFAASITASCRRGRKCDGAARARSPSHRRVKGGFWFDHEIGRGGDIIGFIKLERGCSFVDALDHAAQYVSELRNGHHSSRPASRPAPRQTVDDDGDDEKRITQALAIWCEARPLTGTIAEKYLRSRCIEVPGEALEVLRFHPRCPWGIGTRPAMVALVRDIITDEPTGIHRTALTVDGRKLDRPKLLGPSAGGAIKLSSDYVTNELTIGEGIETTLSRHDPGLRPRMVGDRCRRYREVSGNALDQAAHRHRRQRCERDRREGRRGMPGAMGGGGA